MSVFDDLFPDNFPDNVRKEGDDSLEDLRRRVAELEHIIFRHTHSIRVGVTKTGEAQVDDRDQPE